MNRATTILVLKFPFQSSFGGGEVHTLQVIDGLTKLGFDFALYSRDPHLLKAFAARQLPYQRIWAPPEPVTEWSSLLFFLLGIPFGIILIGRLFLFRLMHPKPVLYCLSLSEKIIATIPARLLGYRVVWMEHIVPGRWLKWNPFRPFLMLASRAATIVALSHAVASRLISCGYAKKRITVIHPGVDLATHLYAPAWPRTKGKFHVAIIGRLHREKGHDILLKAMQNIREVIPFASLSVIGEGRELRSLRWLARTLGLDQVVHFVGFQDDVPAWLKQIDVLILPSRVEESFGIVLIDSMACGVPVVATQRGGVQEIVTHAMDGLLLPNGTSEEIVQAVLYLFNNRDRARKIITHARATVEERFSLEEMTAKMAHLLRR